MGTFDYILYLHNYYNYVNFLATDGKLSKRFVRYKCKEKSWIYQKINIYMFCLQ